MKNYNKFLLVFKNEILYQSLKIYKVLAQVYNMEPKLKLENIENFKKTLENKEKSLKFEDIDKYFYIKHYFYGYNIIYSENDFNEICLEIALNTLKSTLQELEYFVNLKPQNYIMASDSEVLSKHILDLSKHYLNFHKQLKQGILLYKTKEHLNQPAFDFFIESYNLLKDYTTYSIGIQKDLIANLDVKYKEIEKDLKTKIEGNMYI